MVTAGIYLLIRSSPLIEYSSTVLVITLWVGAITALFAGCCGLFMNDIKRIIAYSTMSQLGYMTVALSLSNYSLALFHLINHAFFKACLFMAAGQIIHALKDNQSLVKFGGLSKILPLSLQVILVASFALVAIPFTAGYYSKELIISLSRGNYLLNNNIIYWILSFTALLTLLYSIKLIYYSFLSPANSSKNLLNSAHESGYFMSIPLIVLGFASIFSGYLLSDIFIGLGSDLLNESIFIHPNHLSIIDTEFGVSHFYKLFPLILTFLGIILYFTILEFPVNFNSIFYSISKSTSFLIILSRFFNQKFWFELLVNKYIIHSSLNLGYNLNKQLDRGALELIGPYGLTNFFFKLSHFISKLDTYSITHYSRYMVITLSFGILQIYLNNSSLSELLIWLLGLISILFLWDPSYKKAL